MTAIPDFEIAGVVRTRFGLMRDDVNTRICGCGEHAQTVFISRRRNEIPLCPKHAHAHSEQAALRAEAIKRARNTPLRRPVLEQPEAWPVVFDGYLLVEDFDHQEADTEVEDRPAAVDEIDPSRLVVNVPTGGLL